MTTEAERNRNWAMAMIQEANIAASLFSQGLTIVRAMRDDYNNAASVMSLLALGAEKLLKLTIGLAHLSARQPWPELNYMQHTIGHKIVTGNREARALVASLGNVVPAHVEELREQVDVDEVLTAALVALERFGAAGRFYFLDVIGGYPPPPSQRRQGADLEFQPAPGALWTAVTTMVAKSDPAILEAINESATYEQGRARINEIIADSLERWWAFYVACWRAGVIGSEARQYGLEVELRPPTKLPLP